MEKDGVIKFLSAQRARAGIILKCDSHALTVTTDYVDRFPVKFTDKTEFSINGRQSDAAQLRPGDKVKIVSGKASAAQAIDVTRVSLFQEFIENFRHNLFKPLLLFFYMGFLVPLLKIAFEFPQAIYQGLTIYLLISIGWHGGEELAALTGNTLMQAVNFLILGFFTNGLIGLMAYLMLRKFVPTLRNIDAATVAAYYGSDSAGTFVTTLGVLQTLKIAYASYMPVMLAVMEIPGCLLGMLLVSRLRAKGMDARGNMPGEPLYKRSESEPPENPASPTALELVKEVLFNPGLFLLFGGIVTGFLGSLQGYSVVEANDKLFVSLFQGMLCLFLLEMGITASKKLHDLKNASWRFIAFGLLAPNVFAATGMCIAMIFSQFSHQPLQLGTYVLFAVLCGAASYIAVPAIQRMAIPEASPTLPLAASLGLTFSYNVTIGIPLYMLFAQLLLSLFPAQI